ncbi:MAG: DegV family protein [Chloroflexota bacterium]|nr:DegV family protein [Chloroflexota bacterium]
MSRVYVVTDSAAIIEPDVAERLDITIVPLTVRIGDKDYQDGMDLDHEELLLRMGRDRVHPEIVGPTVEQFQRVYDRLMRNTDQILSIHSSARLSHVYREAQTAAREFLGRCDITVVDSETLSLGVSILVQEAARLAQDSVPLGEIVRQIRGMILRVYVVFVTDTLDYLEYSQRISPAQAILGAMLNIRPFLAMEEGDIIPMEKVRARDRGIDKLIEFAGEFSDIEQIVILQSTPYPTPRTKSLRDRLESIAPGHEFPILLYGPLLASHIGPDGMGLMVYEGVGREVLPW